MECIHTYRYAGLVYSFGYGIPGSGAFEMVYEDKFYCEHCLQTEYRNRRVVGNSR